MRSIRTMALATLLLTVLLGACGLADDLTGRISVKVVDAASSSGVLLASFEACPTIGPCIPAPTVPRLGGLYTITLPTGSYRLNVTRSSYLPATIRDVVVGPDATVHLERIALVHTDRDEPAAASGRVRDALTGSGLAGASVSLREGLNTRSGMIVGTPAATDPNGDFVFTNLPAGNYTAQVAATGFATTFFTLRVVGGDANASQNAALPPVGASSLVRMVLTWDAAPADLDAHLTGPSLGGSRYHIYAADPTFAIGGTVYAELNLEASGGVGPETISLYEQLTGTHRFSVHDVTNRLATSSTALANSGARVNVYRGANLEATFHVPVEAGNLWTVFELDGASITPVGEMSYQPNALDVTSLLD